jgi:ABC-type polysaccharide/polyol phosphate export permease
MTTIEKTDLSDNLRREAIPLDAGDVAAGPGSQIVFDTAVGSQKVHAIRDIIGGLSNYHLWSMMGWQDIKQRYRRSTIGPFWVTLSMAFTITGLGLVYGTLFKQNLTTYLPFVCLGMIMWEFISKCILDGSLAFVTLEGLIKQIRLPLTTHIASVIWRHMIILAHNAVIYILVLILFGVRPGWEIFYLVPGFALVLLNLLWVALLFATICVRFRDVPLIVQTIVQMLFFITPVFWLPSLMPQRSVLVLGNPFYHMLELLRAPLLGKAPEIDSWIFLLCTLIIGCLGTFLLFSRFRRRVPYWL